MSDEVYLIEGVAVTPKDRAVFELTKRYLNNKKADFAGNFEKSLNFMYMLVLENHTRKFVITMPNYNDPCVQKGIIPIFRGSKIIQINEEKDLDQLERILINKEA